MSKIVVLAKQVPDTANIRGNAMKEDGTVNRAALPTVFNPEDLNALELALQIKDWTGREVILLTMGPYKAVDIIKQALYMGADAGYLLTDKKFAGSDTWATSYILAEAVRKIGGVDLVIAGRQAIDGDTAQVGPQVAEKLGFNQVTYVTSLNAVEEGTLTVERDGEFQTEVIRAPLPLLLTVTSAANTPRYPSARQMLRYFKADIKENIPAERYAEYKRNGWVIPTLTFADLALDEAHIGLKGSPTKVNAIRDIAVQGGDLKMYDPRLDGIKLLVRDLMKQYVEVQS
jgi:electron transfer flavoprotein beta subunit